MKVLIHKIHMGSSLPSVKAGTPYRIWHRGAWSDFSTVVFPQDVRNCTTCHAKGATQADNWKTNPSAAACGSCHDDVNFATGLNHVNLPQLDDKQCANCHTPQATMDFDASIPGAHLIPENSASLPGLVTKVLRVDNATPGNGSHGHVQRDGQSPATRSTSAKSPRSAWCSPARTPTTERRRPESASPKIPARRRAPTASILTP